jgi:hypothetical protein
LDACRGDDFKDTPPCTCAGKSIKAICRELGISRKVVRKVLRSDETEFKYERNRQPQPKLGPWRDQFDGLLLANEARPSRERLTLIRIFEGLRDLGYEGGYDTVRRYARAWAKERGAVTADAYVPLYYAPGEAYQFDWSHEIVVLGGVTTTVKVAHVRLCHTGCRVPLVRPAINDSGRSCGKPAPLGCRFRRCSRRPRPGCDRPRPMGNHKRRAAAREIGEGLLDGTLRLRVERQPLSLKARAQEQRVGVEVWKTRAVPPLRGHDAQSSDSHLVGLVLAAGFVWAYRPDQSRYDPLHPSQSHQPKPALFQ